MNLEKITHFRYSMEKIHNLSQYNLNYLDKHRVRFSEKKIIYWQRIWVLL